MTQNGGQYLRCSLTTAQYTYCHCPAGHTISDADKEALGLLGHSTGSCSVLSSSIPRSLSARQLSSLSCPSIHCCMELLWPECSTQHLASLNVMWLNPACWSSLPIFKQISILTWFGVICKLTERALDPPISMENTTFDQPLIIFNSIHVQKDWLFLFTMKASWPWSIDFH